MGQCVREVVSCTGTAAEATRKGEVKKQKGRIQSVGRRLVLEKWKDGRVRVKGGSEQP